MSIFNYILLACFVLVSLLLCMMQMGIALDDADVESFSLWAFIASLLAFLPSMLY